MLLSGINQYVYINIHNPTIVKHSIVAMEMCAISTFSLQGHSASLDIACICVCVWVRTRACFLKIQADWTAATLLTVLPAPSCSSTLLLLELREDLREEGLRHAAATARDLLAGPAHGAPCVPLSPPEILRSLAATYTNVDIRHRNPSPYSGSRSAAIDDSWG